MHKALNKLISLSCSTLLAVVLLKFGLATTIAKLCDLEIATLIRCLSKRKSIPRGDSLASLVHMLKKTIGASCP
jgi:hypothetical protein